MLDSTLAPPTRDAVSSRRTRLVSNLFGAALAMLLGAAGEPRAQVRLAFTGDNQDAKGPGAKTLRPEICNLTPWVQALRGWRFQTPSFAGWKTWYGSLTPADIGGIGGAGPYAYQQDVPVWDRNLIAGECQAGNVEYHGVLASDQDGTPAASQLLIKTGSCSEAADFQGAPALACADLGSRQGEPAYYGDECLADTLGMNGGIFSGGFLSSFSGQTQIQAAMPADSFVLNVTKVRWDPRALGGPMYMMSLAMGQEYLGIDMQFLQAIAGKETMFAFVEAGNEAAGSISEWNHYNRDDDGSFTPWEVELPTFGKVVQAYPRFFGKAGACAARYPDVSQAAACAGGDWGTMAAAYLRTPATSPSHTGPDSPQLANAVVTASLTFFWLYDALLHSTDLCFADAIRHGLDPRMALAAIIPGYNRGPNSGFEAPLRDKSIRSDPNASARFSGGNSDYRENVYRLMDTFVTASRQSPACGQGPAGTGRGSASEIYDAAIAWDQVLRFFFGGSGKPGDAEAQGDGGLLLHFDLSPAQRRAIAAELRCAFDRLKGRAPSTAGRESVSYRYDWLSMLRSVKSLMPLHRSMPVQEEFVNWITPRSLAPITCSGKARDTVFPDLALISPARGIPAVADFTVELRAADQGKLVSAEWTADSTWSSWEPAEDAGNGNYRFRPQGRQGNPAGTQNTGRERVLWVRATDACGNSTCQGMDSNALDKPYPVPGPGPDSTADSNSAPKPAPGGALDFSLRFPDGSSTRPSPGAAGQAGLSSFIPVDAQGMALGGKGKGKCPGCLAQADGIPMGPVFVLHTPGPLDYEIRIFTNLGEFVTGGTGSIEAADLPLLARTGDSLADANALYAAPVVWTGADARGRMAGTGAYIVTAVLRTRGNPAAGAPAQRLVARKLFGFIRP